MNDKRDKRARFHLLELLKRMFTLIVIYGLLLYFLVNSVVSYVEYRRVANELAQRTTEYEVLFKKYTEELVKAEKLESDPEYQRSILKESQLYVERDEEPLIIIDE